MEHHDKNLWAIDTRKHLKWQTIIVKTTLWLYNMQWILFLTRNQIKKNYTKKWYSSALMLKSNERKKKIVFLKFTLVNFVEWEWSIVSLSQLLGSCIDTSFCTFHKNNSQTRQLKVHLKKKQMNSFIPIDEKSFQ